MTDEQLRQSLQDRLADLATQRIRVATKLADATQQMATLQLRATEAAPLLVNGHADQAQITLDRVEQEQRRLQRTVAALQTEDTRLAADAATVKDTLDAADVRIALRQRDTHREELQAAVVNLQKQRARSKLSLDDVDGRLYMANQELHELDTQIRNEQQRENQRRATAQFRELNGPTPGFERTRNMVG